MFLLFFILGRDGIEKRRAFEKRKKAFGSKYAVAFSMARIAQYTYKTSITYTFHFSSPSLLTSEPSFSPTPSRAGNFSSRKLHRYTPTQRRAYAESCSHLIISARYSWSPHPRSVALRSFSTRMSRIFFCLPPPSSILVSVGASRTHM